jgi:hypothetical protein
MTIEDPTTRAQYAAVTAGNALKVDASATTQPVSIAATVTVDSELTTADLDTGAGTDTRAVVGMVKAESGGGVLVGSANPLPAAVTDTSNTLVKPGDAANNAVRVNVVAGSGGGGPSIVDNAAFTDGTTSIAPVGFILDETAGTALTENDAAAARIDSKRAQVLVVEDATTRGQRATVTAGNALKVDGSAVTQPVSGTVTANLGTLNGAALDASVTGLQVAQGSTTSGQKGGLSLGAVTTGNPTYTTAQTSPLSLDTAGALRVRIAASDVSSSGGTSAADGATYTAGTTAGTPMMAARDDTSPGVVAEDKVGIVRMSTRRELYSTIRDAAGNERGVNVTAGNALVVDGSASTQPVSGTVTANAGSGTFTVSGTVTANVGTTNGLALDATLTGGTQKSIVRGGQKGTTNTNADITHTASGANHEALDVAIYDASGNQLGLSASPVRVDPTGTTTQPVSGTVTANAGTGTFGTNLAQVAGTATDTNSGNKSAGTQRVVIATDQPQLTNALKVDGSAVTQPVSIAATVTTQSSSSGKTPAFASVSVSASGATQIVAADATRKIKVVSYVLVADAAVTAKWQSASTDLTGAMSLAANGGVSAIGSFDAHLMETSVNQALNLNLGGAVGVRGHISYFLET